MDNKDKLKGILQGLSQIPVHGDGAIIMGQCLIGIKEIISDMEGAQNDQIKTTDSEGVD